MTMAEAPPPPLQILAHPMVPSFCFSTWYREQMMRAPDDLRAHVFFEGGREERMHRQMVMSEARMVKIYTK